MGGRRRLRSAKEVELLTRGLGERGLIQVLRKLCLAYHVTLDDVLLGHAQTGVVRARDASAFLLLNRGLSSNEVGRLLGMDHTSILACRVRHEKRGVGHGIS